MMKCVCCPATSSTCLLWNNSITTPVCLFDCPMCCVFPIFIVIHHTHKILPSILDVNDDDCVVIDINRTLSSVFVILPLKYILLMNPC